MRIRFTRVGYAAAAGAAVAAMLAMSAGAASAHVKPQATTACGSKCTDVSFEVPGPTWLLGAHSGIGLQNNVVRLVQGSNAAYKEDFTRIDVNTVSPQYCEAPPNTSVAQPGSVFTNRQCQLLTSAGLSGATTFQFAYNPNNGGPETLCIGAFDNLAPASGWKLRLEPCGVAADTVMIATPKLPGGFTSTGEWWINGASDNFSTPLVATSPGFAPSQPTWSTVILNGKKAADTQEIHTAPGPF